ncbi:hypothetical protein BDC45DRAFT_576277 [Circinella umbellata]|nr:hypothetical protein BDC45DRAFT_576277 [Circinella umbellata]
MAADMGNEEKKIRNIQVIGIISTHLRMNNMVLDMPAGYVCRVTPLIEQRIGATLGELFHTIYLPFLEQVIRLKVVVKGTIDVVTGIDNESDSDTENRTAYLQRTQSEVKNKTIKTLLL